MKIELKEVTIRDVVKGYIDNDEEGVFGYDGKLNIRPNTSVNLYMMKKIML